jgi:hypothetical protein
MDLEETGTRNDCAVEGQQQFNLPTDRPTYLWLSQFKVAVVSSEKLVTEAEESSGTQRKGNLRRWKPLPSNG